MSVAKVALLVKTASPLLLLAWAVTALAAPAPQKRPGPEPLAGIDQPRDAAGAFAIWPGSGVPAGSETWTWHEQTVHVPGFTGSSGIARNVVVPTVTVFEPEPGTANGTALVVAPGGAFRFLMMDKEGYDMARWLAGRGVTAFVLRYRLAHVSESDADMLAFMQNLVRVLPQQARTEEAPPLGDEASEAARAWAEEDGRQAIRFIRRNVSRWGLDAKRIGIAGFSAGGGVAVSAAMEHDAEGRPDFAAGIYPGYRRGMAVPADAPPLFIAIADDDVLVSPISAARLYEAWHKAGKPAELHVFAGGRHGFGMNQQHLPSDATRVGRHPREVAGITGTAHSCDATGWSEMSTGILATDLTSRAKAKSSTRSRATTLKWQRWRTWTRETDYARNRTSRRACTGSS